MVVDCRVRTPHRLGPLVASILGRGLTSVIDGQDPPVQFGAAIGRLFSPRRTLIGNVTVGLTDTAPDVTVGLGWRLTF